MTAFDPSPFDRWRIVDRWWTPSPERTEYRAFERGGRKFTISWRAVRPGGRDSWPGRLRRGGEAAT